MNNYEREKEKLKGMLALGWLSLGTILEAIMLLAYLIWQTKIAMFLFGASTLLFVIALFIFLAWKRGLKKYRK
ncbi:hypothetical protein [Weissella minor]|nr:hypothetical protein [Weissella minor]